MTFLAGLLAGVIVTWCALLLIGRHINRKRARELDREYRDLVRVLGR